MALKHTWVGNSLSDLKVAERKKEGVGSSLSQEKEDVSSQQKVDSRLKIHEQKEEEESSQKETDEVGESQPVAVSLFAGSGPRPCHFNMATMRYLRSKVNAATTLTAMMRNTDAEGNSGTGVGVPVPGSV